MDLISVERSLPDVSINPPGPLEVRPGGQVNLTCTGTGFPLPSLTWYQNERRMAQKESGLGRADPSLTASKTIFIKELFTTSTFRCEAVNDFGWKSVETKVTVLGKDCLMLLTVGHVVRFRSWIHASSDSTPCSCHKHYANLEATCVSEWPDYRK